MLAVISSARSGERGGGDARRMRRHQHIGQFAERQLTRQALPVRSRIAVPDVDRGGPYPTLVERVVAAPALPRADRARH